MDGWTDKASYRVACPQLKRRKRNLKTPQKHLLNHHCFNNAKLQVLGKSESSETDIIAGNFRSQALGVNFHGKQVVFGQKFAETW